MRIRHIEILHAILTEGSISAAADLLNVSQPALSMALKQAEDALKYPLFIRSKNGLVPTPQAERLYQQSTELMRSVERLGQLAKNLQNETDELIRIGTVPALAFEVVPQAIAQLLKIRPNLRFLIRTITSDNAHEALNCGDVDIAVVFGTPSWAKCDIKHVGEGSVLLATNSKNTNKNIQSISDLTGEDIISIAESCELSRHIKRSLSKSNVVLKDQITTETVYAALNLVKSGFGIALVDIFTSIAVSSRDVKISTIEGIFDIQLSTVFLEGDKKSILFNDFSSEVQRVIDRYKNF